MIVCTLFVHVRLWKGFVCGVGRVKRVNCHAAVCLQLSGRAVVLMIIVGYRCVSAENKSRTARITRLLAVFPFSHVTPGRFSNLILQTLLPFCTRSEQDIGCVRRVLTCQVSSNRAWITQEVMLGAIGVHYAFFWDVIMCFILVEDSNSVLGSNFNISCVA